MLSHRFGNILLLHKKKPPHQGTASPRNKVPCPRDSFRVPALSINHSICQSRNRTNNQAPRSKPSLRLPAQSLRGSSALVLRFPAPLSASPGMNAQPPPCTHPVPICQWDREADSMPTSSILLSVCCHFMKIPVFGCT